MGNVDGDSFGHDHTFTEAEAGRDSASHLSRFLWIAAGDPLDRFLAGAIEGRTASVEWLNSVVTEQSLELDPDGRQRPG